ncbi:unnamed protein product, partial [Arabidopsis halleri]
MGKTASSKVVMNKEELLLFVEKKRKEVFRRDCRDQGINETESDLESSMDKTESSNVIKSKEDSFLALIDLLVESFVAANKESFVQLIKKKKDMGPLRVSKSWALIGPIRFKNE